VAVAADGEATWAAMVRVVDRAMGSAGTGARILGCEDTAARGPRPLAEGSAVPGFHVAEARAPERLALAGRHRFSDYALIFHVDAAAAGGSRLRAETRAVFPGLKGHAYRALVIGTRMHVLVTRRLLGRIKARAERA
jgi:hypothetical protein